MGERKRMVALSAMSRRRVLIVASKGEWAGLVHLPHILHSCGARVTVLTTAKSTLRSSRYVDEIHTIPNAIDALPGALREHLKFNHYEHVILGDDPAVVAVAQHVERADTDGGWVDRWF